MGSHNSPPFRVQRPRWHSSLSPIDVGSLPNPPPLGPSVLTGTPPHVYPLRGTASLLTHCPVFGSDTICDDPGPPLADIILLGLSLAGFPLKVFKTRLLRKGFHTLIKDVLFSSPTDVRSHNKHQSQQISKEEQKQVVKNEQKNVGLFSHSASMRITDDKECKVAVDKI